MVQDVENNDKPSQQDSAKEYTVSSNSALLFLDRVPALAWLRTKLPDQKLRISRTVSILLIGIVISGLIGFTAGWLGAGLRTTTNTAAVLNGNLSPQKAVITSQSDLISNIAKTVGPSAVSVNVTSTASQNTLNFFNLGVPQTQQSAGTGIILTSGGLIITNRHVVPQGTTNVSVTLSNGTQLNDVSVLGETSPTSSLDIAFLKINNPEGQTLVPAVLGDSSTVQTGDAVVAIGNALGQYQNTVTSGIISGYGRSVQASDSSGSQASENLEDLFQTDAAINEGNSGGPLVNMNGQVIGINTALAGNAQDIGFAIPVNDVKGLIQQVESTGKLQQPYLGVYYIPITNDVAQQYKLNVNRGAWIPPSSVVGQNPIISGGPAANAGLKSGDIITEINGTMINQNNSLASIINRDHVGQSVKLTVDRSSKTIHVNVTLGTEPANN
jgi:serine protease Do